MRIGIECSTLAKNRAGIGHYTYQLVKALAHQEGDEEFTLFYNRPLDIMDIPSRMRHALHGPSSTHLWAQTRLPSLCKKHGIDIFHSPGQGIPLLHDGKTVLTVHDLSPMKFPEQKELKSRLIWNCVVPIMAKKADHIITPSNNTRNDVIEMLGMDERKVTRIYEAASEEYYPEIDLKRINDFKRNKALESGYILAVATLEPRKNFPFLFRALKHWLETSKSNATLVIIGKKGWLYHDIFKTFENLNLQRRVRFEGYITDPDLMRLYYSAARFFMLAPLYEGFWLPGVEAMACGTPVLAPNHSSIPEVVGDAGVLMDSFEEEEWAAAMNRLWFDTDRGAWGEKALKRAERFSWDQAAKETLDVYRQVAADAE